MPAERSPIVPNCSADRAVERRDCRVVRSGRQPRHWVEACRVPARPTPTTRHGECVAPEAVDLWCWSGLRGHDLVVERGLFVTLAGVASATLFASYDADARAAEVIPRATLISLETGGHLGHGQTDRVRSEIAKFLATSAGSRASA